MKIGQFRAWHLSFPIMSAFPLNTLSERASCEVEAVRSVFEDSTCLTVSGGSGKLTYTIPNVCKGNFNIPVDYPSDARLTYTVDLITSNHRNKMLQKEVKIAMDLILEENENEEVLFHLIECMRERFETVSYPEIVLEEEEDEDNNDNSEHNGEYKDKLIAEEATAIQIFHGKPFVERKSTFIAHFAYVKNMAEVEKKNGVVVKNEHNEFELALRFLGNELIAIKMAATNFSGKLIVWSILLLLFSFMLLEVFGLSAYFGVTA